MMMMMDLGDGQSQVSLTEENDEHVKSTHSLHCQARPGDRTVSVSGTQGCGKESCQGAGVRVIKWVSPLLGDPLSLPSPVPLPEQGRGDGMYTTVRQSEGTAK